MNTKLNNLFLVLFFHLTLGKCLCQQWPINQADDQNYWDRISCTFGEIHPTNGDHFHTGIDIDINSSNCPARSVQNGIVLSVGNDCVVIEHEYPAGSGQYQRRTKYCHLQSNMNVQANSSISSGNQIALIDNNTSGLGDHLHFEMHQELNGDWFRINPLINDLNWHLVQPIDNYDPQINDLFIEPLRTQTNNVASGYNILLNNGSISNVTNNNIQYAQIHLADKPQGPINTIYSTNNCRIIVWGNIGFIANVRDRGLNDISASGYGLTTKRFFYRINNPYRNTNTIKFDVDFNRIREDNPSEIYREEEVFHTSFNTNNDHLYGNNDFIKLRNTSNIYVFPHKLINNIQSNGIWFTKAHNSTNEIFTTTPTNTADINDETLYSDGKHTIRLEAHDASGRNVQQDIDLIIDNFKPYVKDVTVFQQIGNDFKPQLYHAIWEYNSSSGNITCTPEITAERDPSSIVRILITASEPLTELKMQIDGLDAQPVNMLKYNEDKNQWHRIIHNAQDVWDYKFSFTGEDLAGNELLALSNGSGEGVPIRQNSTTTPWLPVPVCGTDEFHEFGLGCNIAPKSGEEITRKCLEADFIVEIGEPEDGEIPVQFTDNSIGCSYWFWDFGYNNQTYAYPSTPNGGPIVVYYPPGTYTVSLTVEDGGGNVNTKEEVIYINNYNSIPNARFEVSSENACAPAYISFTNISENAKTWEWDLGDGTIINDQNVVTHTYDIAGSYIVTLVVENNLGNDEYTKTIQVTNLCDVEISCWAFQETDYTYNFWIDILSGNGPYWIDVEFGDMNSHSSDGAIWDPSYSVKHTYNNKGNYDVSISVRDNSNNTTTYIIEDVLAGNMQEGPNVDFAINGQISDIVTVGIDELVYIDNITSGGYPPYTFFYWDIKDEQGNVIDWSFSPDGDGDFGEIVFDIRGRYKVLLELTDAEGNSAFKEKTIYVDAGYLGECIDNILPEIRLNDYEWNSLRKVAISEDHILVGLPECRDCFWDGVIIYCPPEVGSNSVLFYHKTSENNWEHIFTNSEEVHSYFGSGVDVDGNWAVVSSGYEFCKPGTDAKVFIFHYENGTWTNTQSVHLNSGSPPRIQIDNQYIYIGGYVYKLNVNDQLWEYYQSTTYEEYCNIAGADLSSNYWAIDGNVKIISDVHYSDNCNGRNSGKVILQELINDEWIDKIDITPVNGGPFDNHYFGRSVDIHKNYFVVGSGYGSYVYHDDCIGSIDHCTFLPQDDNDIFKGNEITLAGNGCQYVLNTDNNITYKGGESIKMKKGFHAKNGSHFLAKKEECIIVSNIDGYPKTEENEFDEEDINTESDKKLTIYPNPNNGIFNILIQGEKLPDYLEIYDIKGILVKKYEPVISNQIEIDITDNLGGLYFIKTILDEEVILKKVMINNEID